mgnify:CR=1 FL=1
MLNKIERRERIKMRIRKIVSGTPAQPRMTVFRSNKQIYVQFIDDLAGVTLATASSLDKEVAEAAAGKTKCEVAALVGKLAAERALAKGISAVAFDRNGYLYHGRVKQLAEAAREGVRRLPEVREHLPREGHHDAARQAAHRPQGLHPLLLLPGVLPEGRDAGRPERTDADFGEIKRENRRTAIAQCPSDSIALRNPTTKWRGYGR